MVAGRLRSLSFLFLDDDTRKMEREHQLQKIMQKEGEEQTLVVFVPEGSFWRASSVM